MKGIDFPIEKTKQEGSVFDLNDLGARQEYFALKSGGAIAKIKEYLESGNTFVAYLLGKKNSGKGTYSKLFMEAIGKEHVGHISVGDIVRDVHGSLSDEAKKQELVDFLKANYRGFHSIEETVGLVEGRDQSSLISTELIVTLLKYEISKRPRQAIFIDGFPRGLDQVNYSLFLKDLLGYRNDPDFFIFIDVPEAVIDERIKYRVICSICKTPRNLKLLATKDVGYDREKDVFYLMCDCPTCNKARMITKEGDELGVEPIRKRLETDDQIFRQLLGLTGVPKVLLRNSVPVDKAKEYLDDYEITPEYYYERDGNSIRTLERSWTIADDNGISSYSLLPAAVAVSLLRQVAKILTL